MIRRMEAQIFNYKSLLDDVEEKLASGRITLDKYDAQKADLLKLIAEYQTKLDDKTVKLQAKEQELDRMTRDIERVGRIAQPFRNRQIDFEPPRITGKPTIFGVDKWIEEQNRSIASRFVKIVRQIEALYRKDAELQVQAVQRNELVDYQELKRLQQENMRLTDLNDNQTALMQEFLDQMAEPSAQELDLHHRRCFNRRTTCSRFIRRRQWQLLIRPPAGTAGGRMRRKKRIGEGVYYTWHESSIILKRELCVRKNALNSKNPPINC